MTDTITNAAELDALPVGSVVALVQHHSDSVWALSQVGWLRTGDASETETARMYRRLPLVVLYRPDQPAQPTVKPSREAVAQAIFRAILLPWPGQYWESDGTEGRREVCRTAADAVRALLPGRTEQDVLYEAAHRLRDSGLTRAAYLLELMADGEAQS